MGGSWPAARRRSSRARAESESGAGGAAAGGGGAGRRLRLGLGLAAAQALQARERVGPAAVAARGGVEHDAAAEGVGRRDRAHDDAVAGARHERLLQARLPQPVAEVGQARGRLARAVVHVRAHPVRRVAQRERAVEDPRRRHGARRRDDVAARDVAHASIPTRLSATRWPAAARSTGSSWTWTRAHAHRRRPPAAATRRSPRATAPDHSVPVTTVPAPRMVKARSTCSSGAPAPAARPGRRGRDARRGPRARRRRRRRCAPSTARPRRRGAARRASARRALGSTRSPWSARRRRRRTPSAASIATCSRVCGITPSSAATTRRYRSIPVAPATIVRTKRSWPGTSTTDSRAPDGSASGA